jgi:hypothetical protein
VTSLSRTKGRAAGGQRITVHGHSFTHVRRVMFGKVRGTAVNVLGPRRLRVTTPAHRQGIFGVRVVTGHGTSPVSVRFRFIKRPAITSTRPAAGGTRGGTTVHITGKRLGTARRVLFGGEAGTALHVSSPTALRVVAPPHAAGAVDVRVVTDYGTSRIVSADRFTYAARPTVTAVNPDHGPTGGGTVVTVNGTNLALASSVWFGANRGTELSVVSSTQLTVVAPEHASGSVHVTVRTPGGTSAKTSANVYTYE